MPATLPDNAFIFNAPINHWRCDFSKDRLVTIRPVTADTKIEPTLPHHLKWRDTLQAFFESKGKIIPPFQTPSVGTPFQHRVWQYLCQIPAGTTQTYQQLATALSTWPRPVGQACRVNPYPLIIPCHRVVAKQGLGGYMGPNETGLAIKRALLDLEQETS